MKRLEHYKSEFANITTEGVLEYNCDYSKIFAKLPSTWTSSCLEQFNINLTNIC